jgi:hypothetical protein
MENSLSHGHPKLHWHNHTEKIHLFCGFLDFFFYEFVNSSGMGVFGKTRSKTKMIRGNKWMHLISKRLFE